MPRIVFFSDAPVRARQNVRRRLHSPRKHPANPLLAPAAPWEKHGFGWPTILHDAEDNLFKAWYEAIDEFPAGAYAVSRDGIRWERPALGRIAWRGSKNNNLFYRGIHKQGVNKALCPNVIKRGPGDWHMYYWDSPRPAAAPGVIHFTSKDGIAWRRARRNPVVQSPVDRAGSGGAGDVVRVTYDPAAEQFILCQRALAFENLDKPAAQKHVPGERLQRRIAIAFSHDGEKFSPLRTVLAPTLDDPPDLEFFGMAAFRHGDYYLGHLLRLRADKPRIDIELAFSDDAREWKRVAPGRPYIGVGPVGAPDSNVLHCATAPILARDRLYIYYWGLNSNLRGGTVDGKPARPTINLAIADPDRIVSVSAAKEGWLLLAPTRLTGAPLHLNAAAARGGIRCALRHPDTFAEIPGFGFEESLPATGDAPNLELRWQNGPSIRSLRGRRALIHLALTHADIFSVSV